ncbi:MAG TPA: TraR/DksA family transcriptional regulator [Pirellulales bacterium]|jgi:RNA polymerase-binding protein DksA|nr:TraR/DksA family transcriptional regulator [Pirellulales bacterium]
MESSKVRRYRERLLEMRRRMAGEFTQMVEKIPDHVAATGDVSSAPTHLGDVDSEGLDAEIELIHNEEGMINSIDDAIKRTEDGTFGKCQRCGKEIATARLDAIPYAPRCIDCARLDGASQ